MKRARRIRRLPDGGTTKNSKKYVLAWEAVAKPIEQLFGWTLAAYDPDLRFIDSNGNSHDIDLQTSSMLLYYYTVLRPSSLIFS